MIDLTQPYCCYRTVHPATGFFYIGKGSTDKVVAGLYKGSGTRFKLALTLPTFAYNTWTTVVLSTHPTEDLAYAEEARLVPLASLANPFCLNMQAGGRAGRYQKQAQLLRQHKKKEKAGQSIDEKVRRIKSTSGRAK